jgi:hypothetical protein
MLGQIMARLQEGDKAMGAMVNEIKDMRNALGRLPCKEQASVLETINKSYEELKKQIDKKSEQSISLRQGLIIAIVGAGAGAGFGLLFSTITNVAQAAGG